MKKESLEFTHKGPEIYLTNPLPKKDRDIITWPTNPRFIVSQLKHYLREELGEAKNCPNCGGLLPELTLVYKGKTYSFTCTQIIGKRGWVIAKTNYEQFSKYCQAKTYG